MTKMYAICKLETEVESQDDKNETSVDERILGIQMRKRQIMVDILNDPTLNFRETCSLNGKISIDDLKFMIGK